MSARDAGEHSAPRLLPRRTVLAAAFALATSACGRATDGHDAIDNSGGPTGVKGVTRVDGGCPPSPDATPCPYRPLAAELRFIRQDVDASETEIRTSDDGTFSVELPPGRYRVEPDNLTGAPYPDAHPQTVDVVAGEFTTITVTFDSGVR